MYLFTKGVRRLEKDPEDLIGNDNFYFLRNQSGNKLESFSFILKSFEPFSFPLAVVVQYGEGQMQKQLGRKGLQSVGK